MVSASQLGDELTNGQETTNALESLRSTLVVVAWNFEMCSGSGIQISLRRIKNKESSIDPLGFSIHILEKRTMLLYW